MRNKILIFLLSPLFFTSLFSQRKVYTDIQKNDKTYPGKPYSFDKVIDARTNKDNIGTVYKSDISSEYYADLREPLATALMQFLVTTFPNSLPETKITIVINSFEIGHILTGRRKDTGFVKVNFDFYKVENDFSTLIYNYTNRINDINDNIALTHSNRMKRIILMSVAKLDSVVKDGAKPYIKQVVLKNSTIDSIANKIAMEQKRQKEIQDSVLTIKAMETRSNVVSENERFENANYPRSLIIMVGGHAVLCPSTNMFGVNANFLGRLKNHPKILVGFNINFSIIKFIDNPGLAANTSYKLRTSDFGIRILRQLKNAVFYNFNPHMLIGKESFTTYKGVVTVSNGVTSSTAVSSDETDKLFMGCQVDNGIYLLHPKKGGAFFGVDFVMRFTNSDVFDTDFGIKLNVGVAF